MKITGNNTLSVDEISVTSNKYLEEIEIWDERDLPCYKKKVRGRIFSGYLSIVFALLLVYLSYYALSTLAFFIYQDYDAILKEIPALQWVFLGVFLLIVFLVFYKTSKKSMIGLIDSCHGEIAHEGSPFVKKLKVNLVISIILVLAIIGYAVFSALTATEAPTEDYLQTYMFFPAFFAPMFYFIGSITARNGLSICPVCGRYNTVFRIKSSKDFGEKQDGRHIEYDYKTEKVGTEIVTTTWSDGSKTTSSSPIYGSVRYTEEYDDYSNLSKYTYLCRECSYVEETLEEKKWKVLQNKYRG